jgi:uncharacterized protein (DUF1697 family)
MSQRYAAFLRGINVSGRRVGGAELGGALTAVDGIGEAIPFLASGNLVFEDERERDPESLATTIESSIVDRLGFDSAVFLRSAAEVVQLAAFDPFTPAQLEGTTGRPQVVLYREPPEPTARTAVLELASEDDALALEGRELHWLPRAGTQRSSLEWKWIDDLLGTGTMRTSNTIERLAAKFFS